MRREGVLPGSQVAEHGFGRLEQAMSFVDGPAHVRHASAVQLWRRMVREPEVCDDLQCVVHRVERREHDRRQRVEDSRGWAGVERRCSERRVSDGAKVA
jgi:hypothetical protein